MAGLLCVGCKSRNRTGELSPPDGAAEFEGKFRKAFDDDYTHHPVKLTGRAPNDVIDQRLFAARMGYSDLVMLCSVIHVWGKGQHEGRQEQFLEVELGDVLLGGKLPKGTFPEQQLVITGEDDLPGKLQNAKLIMFLKWAPGEIPPYHHHLMPADKDTLAYINAMVQHAKDEGVLSEAGAPTGRRKRPRGRKARAKAKADAAVSTDDELP